MTLNAIPLPPLGRGVNLLLLAPSIAWACSGEGASEAIALSSLIGGLFGALSIAATVFVARRRPKPWIRVLAVVLAVAHPWWWMSALSGDCGYSLRLIAPMYSLLPLGLAALVWKRARSWRRSSFITRST
jgi:hypothetical protein